MLSFVEDILLFLTSNFLLFGILVITLVSFLSFLCFLLATILSIRDKTKYYSRLKSIQWSSDKFSFVQELNSLNKLVNEWFDKKKICLISKRLLFHKQNNMEKRCFYRLSCLFVAHAAYSRN